MSYPLLSNMVLEFGPELGSIQDEATCRKTG